jgi:hypothetical protein
MLDKMLVQIKFLVEIIIRRRRKTGADWGKKEGQSISGFDITLEDICNFHS